MAVIIIIDDAELSQRSLVRPLPAHNCQIRKGADPYRRLMVGASTALPATYIKSIPRIPIAFSHRQAVRGSRSISGYELYTSILPCSRMRALSRQSIKYQSQVIASTRIWPVRTSMLCSSRYDKVHCSSAAAKLIGTALSLVGSMVPRSTIHRVGVG
jgi:hypothetical protein